jgi:hypothetical protein
MMVAMLLTMLSWYWQWHSDETGVEMPTQRLLAVQITVNDSQITPKSPLMTPKSRSNHRHNVPDNVALVLAVAQ